MASALVLLESFEKALADLAPKLFGFQHFDIWAIAEQIHDQLAVFRVGEFEQVAAIGEEAAALIGVPSLARDPAGHARRESQSGAAGFGAAEDAVAAAQFAIELFFGDLGGGGVEHRDLLDGVESEAAERFAVMTPGVHVPVIAVVDESLGGDLAMSVFVAGAAEVEQVQPSAHEDGRADGLEVFDGDGTGGGRRDAHAAHEFLDGAFGAAEKLLEQLA